MCIAIKSALNTNVCVFDLFIKKTPFMTILVTQRRYISPICDSGMRQLHSVILNTSSNKQLPVLPAHNSQSSTLSLTLFYKWSIIRNTLYVKQTIYKSKLKTSLNTLTYLRMSEPYEMLFIFSEILAATSFIAFSSTLQTFLSYVYKPLISSSTSLNWV